MRDDWKSDLNDVQNQAGNWYNLHGEGSGEEQEEVEAEGHKFEGLDNMY
jgi:hypothetical protein